MNEVVLKIDNVSKQYRLGIVGTGTLSHDLNRWWHYIRGKEDPYMEIGAINNRAQKGGDYVLALKDINFEVKQGEVLGIIGKNGAGKSTLLKLLSQVTSPTTGSIKVKGRIAALLEVGTGFHPELTGRENIFLNGAILGMTKREIRSKLDEIVDFSGCAKYIDTPVKRYSSGMTVRLGFAVAAHLDPEILIVDEVLAVGDAEFQKKCIGKMKEVSGEGRTVIFVSHNMASIQNLCSSAILLTNGEIGQRGKVKDIIEMYIHENVMNSGNDKIIENKRTNPQLGRQIKFSSVGVLNGDGKLNDSLLFREPFSIVLGGEIYEDLEGLSFGVKISMSDDTSLLASLSEEVDIYYDLKKKDVNFSIEVNFQNRLILSPGKYLVSISVRKGKESLDFLGNCLTFSVSDVVFNKGLPHTGTWVPIIGQPDWQNTIV
jgi:lipopolysaccharide transport system ATP-binding protein